MVRKPTFLAVAAMLLPLVSYANKSTDTQHEVERLRKQNAELNFKVNDLYSRVDALSGQQQPLPKKRKAQNYQAAQQFPLCGCANTLNNPATYIKNSYPYFYDIITQNSPKSNANRDICVMGMMCFSALANFDLFLLDRKGILNEPGGSFYGVGVRPLFGEHYTQVIGNIENVDLFIDMAVNNWVTGHFDFAYVNASTKITTFVHSEKDWGSVYRNAAALKVNQAYFLLANPAVTPFYFQIGRFNSTFGDYDAFPISRTLTQFLEEQRTGGVNVGAIFNCGLYASANWTVAQQSFDDETGNSDTLYFGTNKDRNYGGKLGFKGPISENFRIAVDASYTADIRDADYLTEGYTFFNSEFRKLPFIEFLFQNQFVRMDRTPGFAVHAEVDYCNFGVYGNYVTALNSLNPGNSGDSRIWAFDLSANVKFLTAGCPVKFEVGYQRAGETDVYFVYPAVFLIPPGEANGPLFTGNILPEDRFVGTIWLGFMPHVTLALQYLHDRDFDCEHNGTGKKSNFGIVRISVEV